MRPASSSLLPKLFLLFLNLLFLAGFLYLTLQEQHSPSTNSLTFLTDSQSVQFTEKQPQNPQPLDPKLTHEPNPTPKTPIDPVPTSEPDPKPSPNPEENHRPDPEPTQTTSLPHNKSAISAKEAAIERERASYYGTKGGVIPISDPRNRLICKLKNQKSCYSQFVAEHVDLLYSFSPIYAAFQKRFPQLYHHHTNFIGYMKTIGIQSVVLEAIYPGQKYLVTKAGNEPYEIQVKIDDYVYYRENLLNVAIRKTKHLDYEYIVWIDSHQVFLNPYWWEEGIYQMAKYPTVSLFHSVSHYSDNRNRTFNKWKDLYGVQYILQNTGDIHAWIDGKQGQWKGWQGNAVGVRREVYDKIEFILDYCIIGCCDCAFNYATMTSYWNLFDVFGNYGNQLMPWIEKSRKVLGKKNGVVRGRVYHLYHEHYYGGYGGLSGKLKEKEYDLQKEIYRDENFTMHIHPDSVLKSWCIPPVADKIY